MEHTVVRSIRNLNLNPDDRQESGHFDCSYKKLTSLDGAPQAVIDFNCYRNNLTNLIGGPQDLTGDYACFRNELTSLEGAPPELGGNFDCSSNKLTSLKWAPAKVGSYFTCEHNQITSLEGAPAIINGYFDCSSNKLTSLQGIHRIIKEINTEAIFKSNPIKSHILGLLRIKKLKFVTLPDELYEAQKIITKVLVLDYDKRDVIACQDELIDAGFDELAKL
jgi:hypothetical protein